METAYQLCLLERVIPLSSVKRKAELRPANLFFVELIIVLLFFSFSAAVILQVFAAADKRQKTSALTERAIICAQSIAEAYSVSGDVEKAIQHTFGNELSSATISEASIKLDDDFNICTDNPAITLSYIESEEVTEAGALSQLTMTFTYLQDKELYSVCCYSYISYGGVADE